MPPAWWFLEVVRELLGRVRAVAVVFFASFQHAPVRHRVRDQLARHISAHVQQEHHANSQAVHVLRFIFEYVQVPPRDFARELIY